jgi:glycine/D-amino acid oxidase-like deaminating enzyme
MAVRAGSRFASVEPLHLSYWAKSAPGDGYPPLEHDLECEVAVIGGGIVGVSTALELAREGARVALLEARSIGSGATGYTTAKISSLHGLTYAKLESSLGAAVARAYGEANEAGLAEIAARVEELAIDCDFRRKPNYTYTESESGVSSVMEEADAAKRAGLPTTFVGDAEGLPFPVAGAVRLSAQAEFHPLKYLHALARAAAEAGCVICEGSRVVSVDQGNPCRLRTEGGSTVRASQLVVATHLPILTAASTSPSPTLSAPTCCLRGCETRCPRACT